MYLLLPQSSHSAELNPRNTAILIFAQNPGRDAFSKGIPGGDRLFEKLTASAILKARRTGLHCFHSGSADQTGACFGERLANAMERCFREGVDNLIVIGNDSPALRTRDLLEAADMLEREKAILGPAADGGVYLIGMHRSVFNRGDFQSLPWKDNSLFYHMLEGLHAETGKRPAIMECQADLDSLVDLQNWAGNIVITGSEVIRMIRGLISRLARPSGALPACPPETYRRKSYNKGSPGPATSHHPYPMALLPGW